MENNIQNNKKPKPKWLFPLLLVVGIIFLGLGIWAGYNNWNKLKTLQQPIGGEQDNEFTDWQIHQNNEFGIEVKYPLNFLTGEPIVIGGNCDYRGFPEKCPNIDNILVQNNLESAENLKYSNYWSIKPMRTNYSANNNNFCLFTTNDAAAGTMYMASYYVIVKNNQCVILRLVVPYPNCGNYSDESEISKCEQDNLDKPQKVDQILSTFKFIGHSETSDWKTYRNEEYGFEFKLPAKWRDALIEKIYDNTYNGDIFVIKLENNNICDISVYPNGDWKRLQEADTPNKPIYLNQKDDFVFGWGCGQDDYGYKGFEDFNNAIDAGNLDAINSGEILGPFAEFKKLILPTFKFIK